MWKPLILLFSVAVQALPDNSVPLVAYKKLVSGVEVYKYTARRFADRPQDFTIVNEGNKRDGDFTYVKVFNNKEYIDTGGKVDKFETKYDICEVQFKNGLSTHILSDSGCMLDLVSIKVRNKVSKINKDSHFFVSREPPQLHSGVKVFLKQCRDRNDTVYFTQLTTVELASGSDTLTDHTEWFWAYNSSERVCPEKETVRSNGHIRQSELVDGFFPNQLTLECNPGYQVEGTKDVYCNGGNWNEALGSCTKVSCEEPSNPAKGKFEGNDFFYQDVIRYSCNKGYKVDNPFNAIRTCGRNGKWNPAAEPHCERKSCGSPGDLMFGSMKTEGEKYLDIARYKCDQGFKLIGNRERVCISDGTWTGSRPFCERITCSTLAQPSNGQHDGNAPSKFESGSVVVFKCHKGYKMDGAEILRCQLDPSNDSASWSNNAPLCHVIVCDRPAVNSNVQIEGTDFSFGKSIRFRCRDGFNLRGSSIAICTTNGWDTEAPSCSAKACNNPGIPDNGKRQGDNFNVYTTMTFSCNNGYQLMPQNSETIICLPTTRWNRPSPICEPVKCQDLPRLENGRLSTELFQYGQNIIFECFPGYKLEGNQEITCQANGQWNGDMPQCIPCPRNHYKPGVNQDTCKPCPVRSITLSDATTSIEHCMCEEGSSKQDGGTCIAIRCTTLVAPDNGAISQCEPSSGSQCIFSCQPGYVLSGSRERRCLQNGWSGTPPVCTACPGNTYKAAEGSQICIPCPMNSHTNGKIGEALETCTCKEGYTRRSGSVGSCYDIDECLVDNGGCDDHCVNFEGGFYCECKTPGYELNEDGKTCNMTRTCPKLGQEPTNGRTICHYNADENGYICHFQCQPGYFFVSGINDYVTCGPGTDFVWSHQLLNQTADLPACTKEFFIDTQIPITFAFLSEENNCTAVVPAKREQIIANIRNVISEFAVCTKIGDGRCGMKYLVLNCADLPHSNLLKVDVSFELYLNNTNEDEVGPMCNNDCIRRNMRQMLQDTLQLKNDFESTVKDTEKKKTLENMTQGQMTVDSSSFTYGRPRLLCIDPGRVYTKRRLCVPCGVGTYLAKKDAQTCTPCPIGYFQSKEGQTQCDKCLEGSTTAAERSDHATLCSVREAIISGKGRKRRSLHSQAMMSAEEIDEILAFLD